jgi:class 3 adenylate cyclase/tetratricopeptide (TPR) repeat protein
MPPCPSCGRENPGDARFCNACGSPLPEPVAEREQRKVVTVLFCDLVGSTALGESSDPEVVRARLARTFEDLRAILERHGGTVEKFVGDAVMAVFGIPVSHEDDALRATRAAVEMRAAVAAHGLEARIGVNTGEVVVGGEGETLVTGDTVNVAARLEQAAPTGHILIGPETRLLVRDAARVEAVEPLALKGKSEPVEAFRLVEVRGGAAPLARHPETPLVGRARERERLWRDYEDAVADSTCRLFTLLGPAGIGKSRLVADFLERVGESADVLRGHCLSYGEGITYWPLVEMLVAIGVDPDAVIGTSPAETQLAFRRLLEARAAERPQVVVLDDLQWAEPVFVDLVEHVADLSRGAPIFLLCVARTDLLDARPGWGGGKLNATSALIEPLGGDECEALIENLLGDARLDDETRHRITEASEGNPLFVEEMLAMVREQGGDGEIVVPPTIHALLQARLDSLDREVRVVMERGSVEGQLFHRGSVAQLAPDSVRQEVESHLSTLVRKELIRPDTPTFPGDDAFRFRHLLIRDAAYESLPKATRAELHERFADWLSTHELVERDEIVGYHLEQAHRYRAELDPGDQALPGLAARAAGHLGTAGRGALDRGDFAAGRTLLRRAADLLPTLDEARLALAPDLYAALDEAGDTAQMRELLAEARESRDPILRAVVSILEANLELHTAGAMTMAERVASREAARAVFEEAGSDVGLALYWWSVGREAWFGCRTMEASAAFEITLEHAERAGARRFLHDAVGWVGVSYLLGPMPVSEAVGHAEEIRARLGNSILTEAFLGSGLGVLLAMQGEADRGLELVSESIETFRGAGLAITAGGMGMAESWAARYAGDLATAENVLRASLEQLQSMGDRGYLPTVALELAELLYFEGRYEEVEDLCAIGRATTSPDDVVNFILLDAIEGSLLARGGRHAEAEERVRAALALAEATDFFRVRGDVRIFLSGVLALAGRMDEAAAEALVGLSHYEAKGDVMGTREARERLATLGIEVSG